MVLGATVLAPLPRTLLGALLAIGCQQAAADLREWRPSDHTNTGETGATKKGQVSGEATASPLGVDQVVLSTWQNNCVSCHGRAGAGDGPQAALYQPRDLGDPEFQAQVSDQQLLESIQKGKGKMPGFALPEGTAQGLVRLVRLMSRKPTPEPSAAPAETRSGAPVSPSADGTGAATPSTTASAAPTPIATVE